MTLAEFAAAAQTTPKWVLNAFTTLGHALPYTAEEARNLGLARQIQKTAGMSLPLAYRKAVEALGSPPPGWKAVISESADGSVRVEIDLARYLTSYAAALSRVRNLGTRPRGRPRKAKTEDSGKSAIEAARDYGVDIGLLKSQLRLSPEERLMRLDENLAFVQAMRRGLGK